MGGVKTLDAFFSVSQSVNLYSIFRTIMSLNKRLILYFFCLEFNEECNCRISYKWMDAFSKKTSRFCPTHRRLRSCLIFQNVFIEMIYFFANSFPSGTVHAFCFIAINEKCLVLHWFSNATISKQYWRFPEKDYCSFLHNLQSLNFIASFITNGTLHCKFHFKQRVPKLTFLGSIPRKVPLQS